MGCRWAVQGRQDHKRTSPIDRRLQSDPILEANQTGVWFGARGSEGDAGLELEVKGDLDPGAAVLIPGTVCYLEM